MLLFPSALYFIKFPPKRSPKAITFLSLCSHKMQVFLMEWPIMAWHFTESLQGQKHFVLCIQGSYTLLKENHLLSVKTLVSVLVNWPIVTWELFQGHFLHSSSLFLRHKIEITIVELIHLIFSSMHAKHPHLYFVFCFLFFFFPSPVVSVSWYTYAHAQQHTHTHTTQKEPPTAASGHLSNNPICFLSHDVSHWHGEEKIRFTPPQDPCSCTDMENDFSAAWAHKHYFGLPC